MSDTDVKLALHGAEVNLLEEPAAASTDQVPAPIPRVHDLGETADTTVSTPGNHHLYGALTVFLVCGILALSVGVEWCLKRWSHKNPFMDDFVGLLIPINLAEMLFICVILFPVAMFVASYFRRRHLLVQDSGITIFMLRDGHPEGLDVFGWKDLSRIKFGSIGPEQTIKFTRKDGTSSTILWRHVRDSMGSAEFFSAVRAWAPAVLPTEMPALYKSEESSHTRLWLNSFSQSAGRRSSDELSAGAQLQGGKYEILGQIGQGGQGTAYLAAVKPSAHDEHAENDGADAVSLPDIVVLKEYILPMHHFKTHAILSENAAKLDKEATILERLDHPQIVRLYDHFVEDYRGYLVMKRVEGMTLKELVEAEGKQPETFVVDVTRQICEILTYLHGLSPPIVHRDLTPDNLILQADGTVTLVDFNVAHQLDSDATATVVGKNAYIPPEQFKGKPVAQSDLYALGCTMHYMLTGEESEPITPSSPRALRKEISAAVDAVVQRATAFSAGERFASAQELSNSLLSISSKPSGKSKPSGNRSASPEPPSPEPPSPEPPSPESPSTAQSSPATAREVVRE